MSMQFDFLTTEYGGLTVELWFDPSALPNVPLLPALFKAGQANIVANLGVLALNPVDNFAIGVRRSDGSYLMRSALHTLAAGVRDEQGNFATTAISLPIFQALSPADVADMAPATPLEEGDLTVNSMSLSIIGSALRLIGLADHMGRRRPTPIQFIYDFKLKPFTLMTRPDRVLDVETLELTVRGTSTGLGGALRNLVVRLVQAFIKDRLTGQLEGTIQKKLDASTQAQLAALGGGLKPAVTIQKLTLTPDDGLSLEGMALLLSAEPCPATFSAETRRVRSLAQVNALRLLRDDVLLANERGRALVAVFDTHRRELTRLLWQHPELLRAADALAGQGVAEIDRRTPGHSVLSAATAAQAAALLQQVAGYASPELRAALEALQPQLADFVNLPLTDVLPPQPGVIGQRPGLRRGAPG